jgi:hypothetical protein
MPPILKKKELDSLFFHSSDLSTTTPIVWSESGQK